jgi:hypothetical protein
MVRAINRNKDEFEQGEEVMMADSPILYREMMGEVLIIIEIVTWESCESGFMVQVKHKATENPFKNKLDTNWFKKIKI